MKSRCVKYIVTQVITVDGLPVTLVYPFSATIAVAGRDDDGCPDSNATLLTKLANAEQENARLREVLAWVEWFEHHESRVDLKCPFCFAYQYEGHESDCRLVAALLAKPEEKQ